MLLLVTWMSALLSARFSTCMDLHLKGFLRARNLVFENCNLWRPEPWLLLQKNSNYIQLIPHLHLTTQNDHKRLSFLVLLNHTIINHWFISYLQFIKTWFDRLVPFISVTLMEFQSNFRPYFSLSSSDMASCSSGQELFEGQSSYCWCSSKFHSTTFYSKCDWDLWQQLQLAS